MSMPEQQELPTWRQLTGVRDRSESATASKDLDRARRELNEDGWFPADEKWFPVGAAILRDELAGGAVPGVDELIRRVHVLADRPHPYLPLPSRGGVIDGVAAQVVEPEVLWINPARVFPSSPGLESYFRDQGDWVRADHRTRQDNVRHEPVRGLAEFAARIGHEHGDVEGLEELFGPPETPFISVNGWSTPLGAIFEVDVNGNHRAAALAVLGVPCILARVTWCRGPFDTSSGKSDVEDEVRSTYRALLHACGVASYPDPLSRFLGDSSGIVTQWPILIDTPTTAVHSLAAVEAVTGHSVATIGRLPRSLFDDTEDLLRAGRRVRRILERIADDAVKRRWWQRP